MKGNWELVPEPKIILFFFRRYNPNHSYTSPATLADYVNKPFPEELQSIPGIGPKNVLHLNKPLNESDLAITNAFQLFGKFLCLKESGMNTMVHCDKFYQYLHDKGISSHLNEIVQAVAEKANVMIPGIYDGRLRVRSPASW